MFVRRLVEGKPETGAYFSLGARLNQVSTMMNGYKASKVSTQKNTRKSVKTPMGGVPGTILRMSGRTNSKAPIQIIKLASNFFDKSNRIFLTGLFCQEYLQKVVIFDTQVKTVVLKIALTENKLKKETI